MAEVVPYPVPTSAESVYALERQARQLAFEFADALNLDLRRLADRCAEAAAMTVLPVGAREIYRRLAEDMEVRSLALQSLAVRAAL